MRAAGYSEETSSVTCRALFGEQNEEDLKQAFHAFDKDQQGSIDKAELKKALPLMGESVPDGKIDELFQLVDADRTDTIEFPEFCHLVKGMNPKDGGDSIFASFSKPLSNIGAGLAGWAQNLGSGAHHISSAYNAGLTDLGPGEMRKAGVVIQKFKDAGYPEENACAVCRALFGDQSDEHLREAFNIFEANSSGFIDKEALKRALPLMGEDVPPDKLEELYKECDKNRNGKIEFQEFSRLVKYLNPKDASAPSSGGWGVDLGGFTDWFGGHKEEGEAGSKDS